MRIDYADDDESPNRSYTLSSSFGHKVAKSRSVGCSSRSFSGDFLERISMGFGDFADVADEAQHIKERVKCSSIFGGFSSSFSQSSSAAMVVPTGPLHNWSKSWGWAFTSPMRAFTRSSTKPNDKDGSRRDMVIPSKDSNSDDINTTMASSDTTLNLATERKKKMIWG
ncbi:hypothetical protein NE237_017054 [Protea cynaroides]|uniref:Uncharacterized protein n=1 Tax=Protea cynaroides TaxID=273540 RepID=A0A9Q0QMF4_9MAGN|nr:hypothetical protein NE237_017054 [Protea cynaroides]